MKDLRTQLGKRILQLRKEAGLTQETLAERLNLHGSYVGLLERGQKTPSLETLSRIAAFFHLDLVDLLTDESAGRPAEARIKRIVDLLQKVPRKDLDKLYRVLRLIFEEKT